MSHSVTPELFQTYLAPVLDTAYGVAFYTTSHGGDAERLVEETVVRAYTRFSSFQPRSNFRAWFLRLMVDLFRCQYQGRGSEQELACGEAAADLPVIDPMDVEPRGQSSEFPLQLLRKLDRQQIASAFSELPAEYRIVCALYFMDEFSYAEIADVVGCPVEVTRSRLHRGRKALSHVMRTQVREMYSLA
jgi:RNA polymerase sigma-70 factor (ECF subfamily)